MNDSQGITTVRQAAYAACLVRQEGSPWRSGSTYLVPLTPDGRVLIHAKDMSLSGRQLKPAIYGAVLHTLGISPAAAAGWSPLDPAPPALFGLVLAWLMPRHVHTPGAQQAFSVGEYLCAFDHWGDESGEEVSRDSDAYDGSGVAGAGTFIEYRKEG